MRDRNPGPIAWLVVVLLAIIASGCAAGTAPISTTLPSQAEPAVSVARDSPSALPVSVPVVADRYPDGIPSTLDGKPVLRGPAAIAAAAAASDATPFLVGGWVTYFRGVMSCPSMPSGDTSWLDDCGRPAFSDAPGGTDAALSNAIEVRFVLGSLATGPVVISVSVHDPRASACGSARDACDRLMVAKTILWAGDGATSPTPLSATDVDAVLSKIQPGSAFRALPRDELLFECGDRLPAAALYTPVADPTAMLAVTLVEIEPSVAARDRALILPEGLAGAVSPAALLCTMLASGPSAPESAAFHWLTVANVALLVRTHGDLTDQDRSFIASVADGLAAAAH